MIKEVDEEQSVLDIEILAVQIEENRKHELYKRAAHFLLQLQTHKEQEYTHFKQIMKE
jgi:hypothetical protein